MILSREEKPIRQIEIDLSGPDGNAFALMGRAKVLAKQLRLNLDLACDLLQELGVSNSPKNAGEYITQEMMAGDYENLIRVFDKYFGEYVILYRAEPNSLPNIKYYFVADSTYDSTP